MFITMGATNISLPSASQLDAWNEDLESASAEQVIAWAAERFEGRLVMSSSFGAHSAVMLHLVHRVAPETTVILVDTGYLFPETYRFAEALIARLRLPLHVVSPKITAARQEALYGNLWEQGEEGVAQYLKLNKVEPMARALEETGADAWMAGLRGAQTAHRAGLTRIAIQNGRVKVHPILRWSDEDVETYLRENELPHHPLFEEGFRSIGDVHSTFPTTPDMDPRDGRILGKKRECGLHLPMSAEENKSLTSSGL